MAPGVSVCATDPKCDSAGATWTVVSNDSCNWHRVRLPTGSGTSVTSICVTAMVLRLAGGTSRHRTKKGKVTAQMSRKSERKLIVGLDIGTSKVVAIVGEVTPEDGIEVVGIGSHPSRGLKKGVVVNIESTVQSIQRAVEEAELMAGCEIHAAKLLAERLQAPGDPAGAAVRTVQDR